ncbi:MAG: hypothetical protein QOE11_3410, partial [Solirubrobacteraceae bacterium]|nr:hypothetical protein [Solirubrobacteraceae bacterium]
CGLLLGEERLRRRAGTLARGRLTAGPEFDLVSGTAGAVAALLALSRLLDDERLAQRAARLSDELAGAARPGPQGRAWPATGQRRAHDLCGLAHGASGAAWALLELFAVTGDARHRQAAQHALAYERHWFDERSGDWPDLRGVARSEPRGSFASAYPGTWADGAPGIALARLRAWKVLGDERCRAEAVTALATTAAGVERALLHPGADFSLGSGISGSADVLALGAELAPAGPALASRAAQIGVGRYAGSVEGWPCGGAGGGLAPSLLSGHAGVGLFYLRLHDRTVPSALLVGAPLPGSR